MKNQRCLAEEIYDLQLKLEDAKQQIQGNVRDTDLVRTTLLVQIVAFAAFELLKYSILLETPGAVVLACMQLEICHMQLTLCS